MSFFILYPLSALVHISSIEPIGVLAWYMHFQLKKKKEEKWHGQTSMMGPKPP